VDALGISQGIGCVVCLSGAPGRAYRSLSLEENVMREVWKTSQLILLYTFFLIGRKEFDRRIKAFDF
jgi:hypothetical protein